MSTTTEAMNSKVSGVPSNTINKGLPPWVKVGAQLIEDCEGVAYPAVIDSIDGDVVTVWSPNGYFLVNRRNVTADAIHRYERGSENSDSRYQWIQSCNSNREQAWLNLMPQRFQSGEGKKSFALWLVLAAIFVTIAVTVIPLFTEGNNNIVVTALMVSIITFLALEYRSNQESGLVGWIVNFPVAFLCAMVALPITVILFIIPTIFVPSIENIPFANWLAWICVLGCLISPVRNVVRIVMQKRWINQELCRINAWKIEATERFGQPAHSVDCAAAEITLANAAVEHLSAVEIAKQFSAEHNKAFTVRGDALVMHDRASAQAKQVLINNPGQAAGEWQSVLNETTIKLRNAQSAAAKAVAACESREHGAVTGWWSKN